MQHSEITSDVICMDHLCLCVCLCGELSAHRLQSPPSQGFPVAFVFVCGMIIWSGLSQTAGQTLISSLRTEQTWAADLLWVKTFPTLVFIVFPPGPRECSSPTACAHCFPSVYHFFYFLTRGKKILPHVWAKFHRWQCQPRLQMELWKWAKPKGWWEELGNFFLLGSREPPLSQTTLLILLVPRLLLGMFSFSTAVSSKIPPTGALNWFL